MNNIIKFLQDDLPEYKSEKLFGIFILGKRVQMYSGAINWTSYNNAKKALYYMVRLFKRRNFNSPYYSKFNVSQEEVEELSVDKLLSDGIIEIREVGNS